MKMMRFAWALIALVLMAGNALAAGLPPAGPQITRSALMRALYSSAAAARLSNPHLNAVMTSPPTMTANGTTKPAGQTTAYAVFSTNPFTITGGTVSLAGATVGRVVSSVIASTGGNVSNNGTEATYSRAAFMADANAVTIGVCQTSVPYRFIVNDQYVSLSGTTTTNAGPTCATVDYITLDFTSAGGRALRKIVVETQQNGGFQSATVGATETIQAVNLDNTLCSAFFLDSYAFGSDATLLGDGMGAVDADWLGIQNNTNSAGPGTGWATNNSAFNLLQRVQNLDLALSPCTPNIIVTGASFNDRGNVPATITANALAGFQAMRAQYPNALIFVFGAFPGNTGPSAGMIANENAVAAAVTAMADPSVKFIPVSTALPTTWISGTGTTAVPTGTGNSDVYTDSGGVHPPTAGHLTIGRWQANAVLTAARSMPQQ